MGRKRKIYRCKNCGKILDRKTKSGLCLDCALKKQIEIIKQLKEKKGEYYEKWKIGIIRGTLQAKSGGKAKDKEKWKNHVINSVLKTKERK